NPAEAREVAWRGATYVLQNHTWDGNAQAVISWIPGRGEATGGGSIPDPEDCLPVASPLRRTPILDDKLRQRLYRATRPDLAGPLLARHLRPAWKKEFEPAPAVTNITVLKYKPGRRCVLAYQLPGRSRNGQPAASRPVIGKVFRDERGERLLALQEFLWRDGFGPQAADKIYVPRPLAYVPEMRMLVQEQAAGATLNQLVEDPGLPKLVRRSAEGLAKLHNTPAPAPAGFPLDAYTLASERVNLDRFTADLATMRPADAAAVARLRDALQAWATQLPDPPALTPVHRDFYYSQVLFDEARLTLIDFDLLALGDPALDVANFTAHLYFLGLDRLGHLDALAKEAELFQAVYGRYRPLDATFTQRLHFYQTATFFRLLNVVAPRPGLAQHFETLYTHTAGLINLLES
ncbi:MAG: phosphotransferase, partial [Chloroflexota bacterium]